MNEELSINLIEEDILDVTILEETAFSVNLQNDVVDIGTNDYEKLLNKPQINNTELIGNKSLDDLNIQEKGEYANQRVTNIEIDNLF